MIILLTYTINKRSPSKIEKKNQGQIWSIKNSWWRNQLSSLQKGLIEERVGSGRIFTVQRGSSHRASFLCCTSSPPPPSTHPLPSPAWEKRHEQLRERNKAGGSTVPSDGRGGRCFSGRSDSGLSLLVIFGSALRDAILTLIWPIIPFPSFAGNHLMTTLFGVFGGWSCTL